MMWLTLAGGILLEVLSTLGMRASDGFRKRAWVAPVAVGYVGSFALISQTLALGMPVGRVLKTAAEEMRSKRQQWAREKAAKLPVKILFPLVLFIFPAIFVVLLGPAASDIGGAFG